MINKRGLSGLIVGILVLGVAGLGLAQEEGLQEEAEPQREVIRIERGGLLLDQGKFQVEPSLQYLHYSRNKIVLSGFSLYDVIFIGEISAEEIERNIWIPSLTVRYGLLDFLELEVEVPWQFRHDTIIGGASQNRVEERVSDNDIGDVEAAIYLQFVEEGEYAPGLILNLRGKSHTGKDPYGLEEEQSEIIGTIPLELPTGNGHWGAKAGITAVKSSDPAIIYATVGYYYNFERDILDIGDVDPGDAIEYSLGMGYALNYQLALNFGIQQTWISKTKIDDEKIDGTEVNVASLILGLTYGITKNFAVDFTAGIGLTEDASDLMLQLSLPFSF